MENEEKYFFEDKKCSCGKAFKTMREWSHGICMECHMKNQKEALKNGIIIEY